MILSGLNVLKKKRKKKWFLYRSYIRNALLQIFQPPYSRSRSYRETMFMQMSPEKLSALLYRTFEKAEVKKKNIVYKNGRGRLLFFHFALLSVDFCPDMRTFLWVTHRKKDFQCRTLKNGGEKKIIHRCIDDDRGRKLLQTSCIIYIDRKKKKYKQYILFK